MTQYHDFPLVGIISVKGIKRIPDQVQKYLLNLDRVGAINFDKGCYTGQEIVARTENRGRSRRRMMLYQSQKPGITSAEKVVKGDKVVGDVVNVSGTDVLAVTPLDLHDKPLSVAGIERTPTALPYKI